MYLKYLKYKYFSIAGFIRSRLIGLVEHGKYKASLRLIGRKLKRLDNLRIPKGRNEIRLFCIMRNESLRLFHFIRYYKDLGVDRFFFVDNGSSDGSPEMVLERADSHVFSTDDSYVGHWNWMEYLLERHGMGHWCLVVDVDELFAWPDYEHITLRHLVAYLDSTEETAVRSLLLDLYPRKTIGGSSYVRGEDPLKVLSWFDSNFGKVLFRFADRKNGAYFDMETYTGGVRDRVFGREMPNHLSKISLFKMAKRTYLTQGMHAINHAQVSSLHGVTFHTKFLHDLPAEAREESGREEHFGNAVVYKIMDSAFRNIPDMSFWNENSCELIDSEQLVQIGLMKRPAGFREFIDTHLRVAKQNLDIVS